MSASWNAGPKAAAEAGRSRVVSKSALPKHQPPVRTTVKRMGGGYSMSLQQT